MPINKLETMNLFKSVVLTLSIVLIASCKTNEFSFLKDYSAKTLPLIDSTSFSNHVEGNLLTKKQQRQLGLNTIFGEKLDKETTKVGVSYLPKISENFNSVVYYFYIDNKELTSMLVNYTSDYKIINSQMVAYDEIADGILHCVGTIYNDKILLKEYVADSPTEIEFKILENGDIVRE